MNRIRFLLALSGIAAILGVASAPATLVINAAGLDTTTTNDWRTTTTAKPYDGDHDNTYGSLGYYLFAPSAIGSAFGNNAQGTAFSGPDQKGGVLSNGSLTLGDTGVLATHYHASYGGWSPLDDPTFTPGPTVPDESSGYAYQNAPSANTLYNLLTVAVGPNMPADFRLGLLRTDTRPEDFSFILNSGAATAAIALGTVGFPSGVEYAFFDIHGASLGDTVTIALQTAGSIPNMGLAGITVDAIPEPSTILLLSVGAWLLLARRSLPFSAGGWRRR